MSAVGHSTKPACHGGSRRIELSPPASCLASRASSCLTHPESCTKAGRTGWLPFDDLIGAESSPEHLFTCGRAYPESYRAPRAYTHTAPSKPKLDASAPAGLNAIAIGMPVSGKWLIPGDKMSSQRIASMSTADLCTAGDRLACARHTWMAAAPDLAVLLLADCLPLLKDRLARRNATLATSKQELEKAEKSVGQSTTTPHAPHKSNYADYTFDLPPFLKSSPAPVEARCFWHTCIHAELQTPIANCRAYHTCSRTRSNSCVTACICACTL